MYLGENFKQLLKLLNNTELANRDYTNLTEGKTIEEKILEFLEKLPAQIKEVLAFNKKIKKKLRTDFSPEWGEYKDWSVKFIPGKTSNQTYISKLENIPSGYKFNNINSSTEDMMLITNKNGEIITMSYNSDLELRCSSAKFRFDIMAADGINTELDFTLKGYSTKQKHGMDEIHYINSKTISTEEVNEKTKTEPTL